MSELGEWREWGNKVFSDLERLQETADRVSLQISQIQREIHAIEIKSAKTGAISGLIVSIIVGIFIAVFSKQAGG